MILPVDDFKTMPSGYCPGVLHLMKCIPEVGPEFRIGRLRSSTGKIVWLYPSGNEFAKETAKVCAQDDHGEVRYFRLEESCFIFTSVKTAVPDQRPMRR